MLSHVYPWADAADGGNFGGVERAPLAERPWASVGGRSGAVSVHLCEQGRPQGASISAGDLSRRSRWRALSRRRRVVLLQGAGARSLRPRPHGGSGKPPGDARAIQRGSREPGRAFRRHPRAAVRRRRANRTARKIYPIRRHHRGRRLCRAGQDLPDLGAAAFRRAPGRLARPRPPPGAEGAGAGPAERAGMSGRRSDGRRAAGAAAGGHVPVLLAEMLAALAPQDGALYVDGTFGAGGYSEALLAAARCRVFAIDRDPEAVRRGAALVARHAGRLRLVEGCFGEMDRLVGVAEAAPVAGVALDLGVSSMQLDEPARGFSFRADGPLDMRMSASGTSAADLLATLGEAELSRLI